MGWVNAANKFQSVVQSYLEGLPVVQYIDDIFFTHDCESEHLKTLDEVVTRLTCAGFKLNLKKSQLGRTKVTFLGFEVSDSVSVPFTYLQNITPPHDLLTLEGVIGQLQYISSNVRDFRNIIDPIMSLKKGLRTKVGQKLVTHNRKLSSQELETYQAVMVKIGVLRLREIFKKENISVPKLKELTARVKATCESCKVKGGAQPVIYDHLPIMCDVPGVHFSTDVGECASRGVNGHKFFLVIKDNGPGDQSKIIPLKRVTGNTVSMALSLHLPLTCESLRSDGGPEFKNDKVSCLLESRGIRHIFSIPYESHTNGIAERAVRTIKNHILTNLSSRWDTPEGVSELNVILNRTKLKRTEKKTNPEHVSVLQKGERIWVKRGPVRKGDCIKHNVSGPFIIKDVTGNVVLTDTGLRVHPHQVIK
uniref:ribonuclease H n=1 Tax=Nothobranchius furzeri TaxID=105023 RepID=A0A1A8URZ9_NOTFU